MIFKKLCASVFFLSFCVFGFSTPVTVQTADGFSVTVDVPSDISGIVNEHLAEIQEQIIKNNVTKGQVMEVVEEVNKSYDKILDYVSVKNPVEEIKGNLEVFSKDMTATLSNAQLMQNVWSEAWIGYLIPKGHAGGGVNVGVASIDVTSLKKIGEIFDISLGELPNQLVFPSVAADLRIGGFVLPFDVGFNFLSADSAMIGMSDLLEGMTFSYFTIGGDLRYAILKGGKRRGPTLSVGAGYNYTKADFSYSHEKAGVGVDFDVSTFYLQSQISKKLAFFIPYAGAKLAFSNSSFNWDATINWKNNFSGQNQDFINQAQSWGFLPTNLSDKSSKFHVIPQVFAGFGLDFFILNLTFGVGYDISNSVVSGATSVRLAW